MLADAVSLDEDGPNMRGQRVQGTLPDGVAIVPVQGDHRSRLAPGHADEPIAVEQELVANAEGAVPAREVLGVVLAPAEGAGAGIDAHQVAAGGDRVDVVV